MINHPRRSRAKRATAATVDLAHDHQADYAALLTAVRGAFDATIGQPLFATSAGEGLFGVFLAHLPAERNIHTCSACRRFVENFGALATVADDGAITAAMWRHDMVPTFYAPAITALQNAVAHARITKPFLSPEKIWGLPHTGEWTHFSVQNPRIYTGRPLTAGQAMAAKREDFKTVVAALADFTPDMLAEAMRLLQAEALRSSEKFIGPVRWLQELHTARGSAKNGRLKDNLLWRAIATAPDGYCHPRASVVGSLLEDIAAGLPFAEIKARFDAKLHPLRYQRPLAAPSAGNIAQAEKIVEAMGIAPSLERRFARLDECETAWRPTVPKETLRNGRVFDHLSPKGESAVGAVDMPTQTMTWDKFSRTVLPTAEAMQMRVPGRGNFIALTAAANNDAPPILKWDREEARNTIAWYVYNGGSSASQWKLAPGWCDVTAVVPPPPHWGDRPLHNLATGVVLVLKGAADTRTGQGNALFPECLRTELHAIRATIEAYSRRAEMQGRDEASACGYHLGKGAIDCLLRVTAAGKANDYHIDRWD